LRNPTVERYDECLAAGFDDAQQPVPAAAADDEARRVCLPVPPVVLELDDVDIGQMRDRAFEPGPRQRVAQVERQRLVVVRGVDGRHASDDRPTRPCGAGATPSAYAPRVTAPLVDAARRLADELLRPQAEQVETRGVPLTHLAALAGAGLFGVAAPEAYGGSDQPLATVREIVEVLAGSDASTWFVWTQHHTPVRTLARGTNDALREQWLPRLATGAALAGVAYTHLRRPGPPAVRATRADGGWRIDGDLAWLTSWGLAEVFLIGAIAGDEIVWFLVPLSKTSGVTAQQLDLIAMRGTSTVSVHLEDVFVADADVVLTEPLDEWRTADADRTADVSAAVFGVAAECARRIEVTEVAAALSAELDEVRARAYRLQDEAGPRPERIAARAQAHALALRASAALVAAGAGRSMLATSPAQRLAREALFLLIQAQDADVRAAQLNVLAGLAG
jgi:Acyl-CoA dehydrogenase, N-terminal domain